MKIIKAISGMVVFTMLAKVFGFLREIAVSYFFGASGISDAYLISQTIPSTVFQFVGVGLTTCFIPLFIKIQTNHGKEISDKFTDDILTIIYYFSTIVIIFVWLYTPSIVKMFASGFSSGTLEIACQLTRIGILSLYFSAAIFVYTSYLQANQKFTITAASAIPYSITILLSIVIAANSDIIFLGLGSLVAGFIQMLFLRYQVYKLQYIYRFSINPFNANIGQFFMLMVPVIVGVSVNELNVLVDRTVASRIAIGGISALSYANSLVMLIQGGLGQPIASVFFPKFTEYISLGKDCRATEYLYQSIELLITLMLPIICLFYIFSEDITSIVYGRGAFGIEAIKLTSNALKCYTLGLVFMGIRELLTRYYYAFGDTKRPMLNSSIGVIINILLNIIISKYIGISGLALATSISAFITVALLWKHRPRTDIIIKLPWRNAFIIIAVTILMVIMSYVLNKYIKTALIIKITLISIASLIISYGFTYTLIFRKKIRKIRKDM